MCTTTWQTYIDNYSIGDLHNRKTFVTVNRLSIFLSPLFINVTTPPNGRPISMPDLIRLDIAEQPKEKNQGTIYQTHTSCPELTNALEVGKYEVI